jgi:hypothetical protein
MPGQLSLFKGRKQRGVAAPAPSEFALTCSVADLFRRYIKPGWQWTHIGHGEERTEMAGARLKRAGQQKGWPDFIMIPPNGYSRAGVAHFLELKRKRGGRMSDEQEAFRDWCQHNNVPHEVARELSEVIEIGSRWGLWRGEVQ